MAFYRIVIPDFRRRYICFRFVVFVDRGRSSVLHPIHAAGLCFHINRRLFLCLAVVIEQNKSFRNSIFEQHFDGIGILKLFGQRIDNHSPFDDPVIICHFGRFGHINDSGFVSGFSRCILAIRGYSGDVLDIEAVRNLPRALEGQANADTLVEDRERKRGVALIHRVINTGC